MSNTERQRQFRERNPEYFTRLRAKRQAEAVVRMQQVQLNAVAPLMLPAPVEQDPLLQQLEKMKRTAAGQEPLTLLVGTDA